MKVTPLGRGRYELVTGSKRMLAYAVRHNGDTWVFIDGQVIVVGERDRPADRHRRSLDEAALSAPMPATVVSLHAAPGQRVSGGDLLVTLEAMKMELAVTAPHDGTVQAVHCRPGELVQPGVPLVALTPPEPPGDDGRR